LESIYFDLLINNIWVLFVGFCFQYIQIEYIINYLFRNILLIKANI
jgi:hypothetical protein